MLRKSLESDCIHIYNLICDMEKTQLPYEKFKEIYKKQLNRKNTYCLVDVIDGKTIAFINLRFETQLHHCEQIAEIMEFVVDQQYRNNGIGKKLFMQACIIAKEKGCSQIEVACNKIRNRTHGFYEREGMLSSHYKFTKKLSLSKTNII